MFVMAGSVTFAEAQTSTTTRYASSGYTSVLKGESCTFELFVKSGNKGAGTLYLKDPYLWHQWDYIYLKGGSYYKRFSNVGSSRAYWKGFAENSKVRITVD